MYNVNKYCKIAKKKKKAYLFIYWNQIQREAFNKLANKLESIFYIEK